MATAMKRFQWNKGDKVENLIRCLANYKAQMEYKNIHFSAVKVKQYEAVREAMARIYEKERVHMNVVPRSIVAHKFTLQR